MTIPFSLCLQNIFNLVQNHVRTKKQDIKNKSEADIAKAKEEAKVASLERANKKAEAVNKNIMILTDSLTLYMNAMRQALIEKQPFYAEAELQQVHDNSKLTAISQVRLICSTDSI